MLASRWWLIPLAALLVLLPCAAADDETHEPPADEDTIEFVTGYQGSSIDRELFRVAEYEVVEPNPIAGFSWYTSPYRTTRFELDTRRLNSDQMSGTARLDVNRAFRLDVDVDSLLHRLDHDPISNLQAVSEIKVVRSTDFEPGVDYQIRRRLYDVGAAFRHPEVPGLSFRAGFRSERRDGTRQLLNTSHCTACHTVSQGREVDRATTDFTFGAHLARGRVDLDYEILGRRFEEEGATPTAPYERAYRPAGPPSGDPNALVLPFNDRLWFQDGTFPVNDIPEVRRTAHRLKFRAATGESDSVNVTMVSSTTENRDTNLEYSFTGFRGRYVWKARDDLRLNFYARRDEIENDAVSVDLLQLNGLTGAPVTMYGGFATPLTFESWRRQVDDPNLVFNSFLRQSSLNRTDNRFGVDALWRALRKGSLRLGYRYRLVDRDHVILADGTGETTSHRLTLGWNQRVFKKVRWNNSLRYTATDNPYVNVDGALRAFAGFADEPAGIVLGNAPSPKSTSSYQYYQLHDLRTANMSNSATDELKLRSNVTWSPRGTWAVSGNARYLDTENDELSFSTWEHTNVGIGVNVWVASGPEFQMTMGFDHVDQETDSVVIVPLMDG